MVGMLQHPNILPIYDAGEENGHCYIVTEHVHGARTLTAYCRPDNLLRVDDVLTLMFKCAKALHYAHSRGVIHRDIKPSQHHAHDRQRRRAHRLRHRAGRGRRYLAHRGHRGQPFLHVARAGPVARAHQPVGPLLARRGDVRAAHRAPPVPRRNLAKLLHQIVYATPPPIHSIRADMPAELETVVAKALQKEPEKRYRNGLDFAAAITRVHQKLREDNARIDRQQHFGLLRRLKFFHDFSLARDLGGAARRHLAAARAGRRDRQGRRDGRSLLHHRQRATPRGAPWHGRRQPGGRRLLRRDELRAWRQAPPR